MYVRTALVTKTFEVNKLYILSHLFLPHFLAAARRDTEYGQGLDIGTEVQHSSGLPMPFSSSRQERHGSHTGLRLNLGADFAELVLLITSNLAFICSALHTFPLQHQPFAFSLSLYLDNCDANQNMGR